MTTKEDKRIGEDRKLGKEELLAAEETVLQDISGVLQAMDTMVEYKLFKVVRNGKELFSFRVRGLDDEELEKCRTDVTKIVRNKRSKGLAMPADFNAAKYSSLLIVTATHPDDAKMLWDNGNLQKKADAITSWQVIDKVLKPGEGTSY